MFVLCLPTNNANLKQKRKLYIQGERNAKWLVNYRTLHLSKIHQIKFIGCSINNSINSLTVIWFYMYVCIYPKWFELYQFLPWTCDGDSLIQHQYFTKIGRKSLRNIRISICTATYNYYTISGVWLNFR